MQQKTEKVSVCLKREVLGQTLYVPIHEPSGLSTSLLPMASRNNPLARIAKANDEHARLTRDAELALRQLSVTSWFEQGETRPAGSAKDAEIARQMWVPPPPTHTHRLILLLHSSLTSSLSLPSLPPSSLLCSMDSDLQAASAELVKVRRERLRALYASERAAWQAELGARGLSMETSEVK